MLEHWYRGSLDECHKAGKPTLNPREYLGYDSGWLDRLISNCLDSEENAKCVLVTHLLNPWGVLKGYSPDFGDLDEFEIHKPYKDFDLPLGEAVAKNQNIVRDIISKEIDDDVALMLFEHYCSNRLEALNGYVPTTRDNVDVLTAFLYDVCNEADKRVDNRD